MTRSGPKRRGRAREDPRQIAVGPTAYQPGDEGAAELTACVRRETPPTGLGLDTSQQGPDPDMADVLARVWPKGEVTDPVQAQHARPSGTSQS